ncbi:MAG: hypothetical protein L3J16_07000, partial [Anaerolineales bacterium]|nr:hypothetical protein [Anaerolineales bacterium]
MMRKFDSPYIADWFAISLRWLTLLVLVAALSAAQLLSFTLVWPLGGLVIWNVAMTIMAALNMRIRYHRQWAVVIDTLLIGAFFWIQGGLSGEVPWAGVLPILTAAVYFEIWGGMLSSALIAALELAYVYVKLPDTPLVAGGMAAAVTLGVGALFSLLSYKLINSLRIMRTKTIEVEVKKRHVENERLRAIYELTSTLTATLSYRRVLESALDLSVRALNPDEEEGFDDKLVSAVLLFVGNELVVKSARRFTNADLRVALPAAEGILQSVVTEGEAVLTQNIGYDPELSRVIALRSCT